MPQPLFLEITDFHRQETRIVGLAHITDIVRNTGNDGGNGAAIITDKGTIVTVESYEDIRSALGSIGRITG